MLIIDPDSTTPIIHSVDLSPRTLGEQVLDLFEACGSDAIMFDRSKSVLSDNGTGTHALEYRVLDNDKLRTLAIAAVDGCRKSASTIAKMLGM